MAKVRVRNLVRLANDVRRELSGPISEQRLDKLQQRARDGLRQVEQICAEKGATPEDLPVQSRKAYQYLLQLDWSQVTPSAGADAARAARQSRVRFNGLQKAIDEFAEALSRPEPAEATSRASAAPR